METYYDKIKSSEKSLDATKRKLETLEKKSEARKKRGIFSRLVTWREGRELRNQLLETQQLTELLTKEIDHFKDQMLENHMDAADKIKGEVLEQLNSYGMETGMYPSVAIDLEVYSEKIIEENPSITDYNWFVTIGDEYNYTLEENSSVESIAVELSTHGDLLPITPEEQKEILDTIEKNYHFRENETVFLRSSVSDIDVAVRSSGMQDEWLIEYIPLTDFGDLNAIRESTGKKIAHPSAKTLLEIKSDSIVSSAEQELKNRGLYFSTTPSVGLNYSHNLELVGERNINIYNETVPKLPNYKDVISFAEDYNFLTRVSPEEQKLIYSELNKVDFATDTDPYSYSNSVYDLIEEDGVLSVFVFDDTDRPYEQLIYDPVSDQWKGQRNDFEIENPVPILKEKFEWEGRRSVLRSIAVEKQNEIQQELLSLAQSRGQSIDEKYLPEVYIHPMITDPENVEKETFDSFVLGGIDKKTDKKTFLMSNNIEELYQEYEKMGCLEPIVSENTKGDDFTIITKETSDITESEDYSMEM